MNEIINEKEPGVELNFQELLVAYLRRWKLIAVCVILAASITLGLTLFFVTPTYRASIKVYVNNRTVVDDKEVTSSGDLSASIYLVEGYMVVAKSDTIMEKVAEKLNGDYTVNQLKSAVSTKKVENTVMFYLYVTLPDPKEAARVANVVAEVLPQEIPSIIDGTSAKVVDRAKVPSGRYEPNYSGNTALGAAGGFLAAIVYVTIMFLKDTRIKDENDLTDMFELPILGRIPDFDGEFSSTKYSYTSDKE